MIYIVDTCVLREIFAHVYRTVYPEIWDSLEALLDSDSVSSVKEVYHELERQFSKKGEIMQWLNMYKKAFHAPTNEEAMIVSSLYSNRNFQNGVAEKNILQGMPVADAFLVARAKVHNGVVVTSEQYKPNSAKIPNMCEAVGVACISNVEFQLLLRKRTTNANTLKIAEEDIG